MYTHPYGGGDSGDGVAAAEGAPDFDKVWHEQRRVAPNVATVWEWSDYDLGESLVIARLVSGQATALRLSHTLVVFYGCVYN